MIRGARPHAAFAGVASADPPAMLILRSSTRPNLWKLPGGGLRSGETWTEGLRRELNEELRVVLEPGGLVMVREESVDAGAVLSISYAPVAVETIFVPRLSEEHDQYSWWRIGTVLPAGFDSRLSSRELGTLLRALFALAVGGLGGSIK